jgi:hypothetical protein
MCAFLNRVRSLFNIDHYLLPELTERDWQEFRDDPPRYFMNKADLPQLRAIWREVEKRQRPRMVTDRDIEEGAEGGPS